MISLNFNIRNPFRERFEIIKCWSGSTLLPNKFWELQINKTGDIISLGINLTTRQDHAGILFDVSLLGYELIFNLYDNRHWDREKNQWCVYDV